MAEPMYDLVVIGSGAAGLSAALKAAELGARVAVLTAGQLLAGSSPRAQGGVAAALGADDTAALHAADTLAVGAGLNDRRAVDVLTREGGPSVQHLGPLFESERGLEAGHARRRILHAGGGATGHVLTSALLQRACASPAITLVDHARVSTLVLEDRRVVGAGVAAKVNFAAPDRQVSRVFGSRAVLLATGGYAALWGRSTNAPETRGSGLALAWEAGASLADLEFVQFHPTALSVPGRPAFLLSEALRGEGGRLIDADGHEVVDPLLPRDVVARALHRHILQRGPVFLSLQHLDPRPLYERFGRLAATVRDEYGLDLAGDPLPVAPAAHYCMGGVRTDTWGRTDVRGLYAAGEVACSGVQGANRLASNSLLECLVFGARAAVAALNDLPGTRAHWQTKDVPASSARVSTRDTTHETFRAGSSLEHSSLAARLDADLGVERSADGLTRLIAELPTTAKTSDDSLLVPLIARAALLRAESRGAHFRLDAPTENTTWRGRIHWRRATPPSFEEVAA